MNRDDIKAIIPHREPMLLVDEVTIDDGGVAHGKYTVTGDEWFLQGHFPDNPIVPGVIQCEMAAQVCCALFIEEVSGNLPLFTGMNNVRFKSQVKPGDTIDFTCATVKSHPPFYFVSFTGAVCGKVCASGELSFCIMSR